MSGWRWAQLCSSQTDADLIATPPSITPVSDFLRRCRIARLRSPGSSSRVFPAMSTAGAKGPSVLQPQAAASSVAAPANPLWDFYACGLVDENDDGSAGEDTEDELETQDWILFQRQRAQARLANACQREARVAAKH